MSEQLKSVPACKECKYFQESADEMFSTCALYHYEGVDYFNGKVNRYNSLALAMRESEDRCGRGGKDFEQREVVEEVEAPPFLWYRIENLFRV